ncbi:uncharacterized protein LOC135155856 [Lytechinus pictus]|uniref:uncharacterized protein LOC135155856 n=1 Tax=Lytechinus pictus TaxID=7653 RepID=UPI0030BA06BE
MPIGGRRAGGGFGGRRAGHGFGGHGFGNRGIGGHGFGGHGFGNHGIGARHHFHNRNNRRHHRGGNFNHGPVNVGIQWNNQNGVNTISVVDGPGIRAPRQTSSNAGILVLLVILGTLGLIVGAVLGTLGAWTYSFLGIAGIVGIVIAGICWGVILLIVICHAINHSDTPPPNAGETQATVPVQNQMVPAVTIQGGPSTLASQGVDTTSYVFQTSGVLPGGRHMAPHTFNIQVPPNTAQSFQNLLQNFPGSPNPSPVPNESLPYPPTSSNAPGVDPTPIYPGVNMATAPPMGYPFARPPPPDTSNKGVVEPTPEVEDMPPPPSYDDAVTGKVELNETSDVGKT